MKRIWIPLFALLIALAAPALIGCGAADSPATTGAKETVAVGKIVASGRLEREIASDRIFTVDDLLNAGFKRSKSYDVTSLEKATAAIYGFYGEDDYKRQEYELRLYASHQDAVQYGGPMAEEGSGPNAKVVEDEASWKEGIRERRACEGNVRGSHHVGKCTNPKYGDYMIVGNLIMLCQGQDSATAIANCQAFLRKLGVP